MLGDRWSFNTGMIFKKCFPPFYKGKHCDAFRTAEKKTYSYFSIRKKIQQHKDITVFLSIFLGGTYTLKTSLIQIWS